MAIHCPKCGAGLKLEMGVVLAAGFPELPRTEKTSAPPPQRSAEPPASGPMLVHNLGALLMRINDRRLEPHELKFVTEVRQKFGKSGSNTRLTEKQGNWLKRIAERAPAVA